MIYLLLCALVLVSLVLSYPLVKTYQLCGYKPWSFLQQCITLNFSFGDKNRLVFTKRMVRYVVILALVLAALFFLPLYFVGSALLASFDCVVVVLFLPFWIIAAHYISLPLEFIIKRFYIAKAKRKLGKKKLIKIAITGSYGKTSVKNILKHILEKEYKVCATPKNYNTEMGTTLTILRQLDDHDIFISEMGARQRKDIEKLTKLVAPDIGIITSVGMCHLETFKSIERVAATKYELAQNLKAEGEMFFFAGGKEIEGLYKKFQGKKVLVGGENGFAYAKEEKISQDGCSFILVIDGKEIDVTTRLLGKFNIDNIVLASAVAHRLGVSLEDIKNAIKSLESTPHRLQLIKNNYLCVLDDAYNSNEVGFAQALDVLARFDGRKIVVTPGMVELGEKQSEINFKLGGKIADVCDYLIIMNNVNKNELMSGAISHNFKKENIYFAQNRKQQSQLIKMLSCKGCVILFENDLPDNYQ